jgi:hypothetical protein
MYIYNKPDFFIEGYNCAEPGLCVDCFWFNGEQCVRQLLTEDDINDIKNRKDGSSR